jgi:hypothetical protein
VCIHEAGHAMAAVALDVPITRISAVPAPGELGNCRFQGGKLVDARWPVISLPAARPSV